MYCGKKIGVVHGYNTDNPKEKTLKNKQSVKDRLLIMMVGPPASGKSRLTKRIEELYNFKCINNDGIRKRQLNFDYSKKGRDHIFAVSIKKLEYYIHQQKNIIIDTTNKRKEDRKEIYKTIINKGYCILILFFDFEINVLLENNKNRTFAYKEMTY